MIKGSGSAEGYAEVCLRGHGEVSGEGYVGGWECGCRKSTEELDGLVGSNTVPRSTSLKHEFQFVSTYSQNAATATAFIIIFEVLPLNNNGTAAIGKQQMENKSSGELMCLKCLHG